jgi:monoamine oxidase
VPPKRVAVVGAGLAGLAASLELARARVEVILIEARSRAGGRVWTERDAFDHGQHGELGGEFIDSNHRRMRRLARELGLALVPVLAGGFVQRIAPPGESPQVLRTGGWDVLTGLVAPLVSRYKAARERDDAPAVRELSTVSLRDWLRRCGAGADAHAVADALRGFFVAEPDDFSVLQLVELVADGDSPAHTKVLRIEGGNDRLVHGLLDAARPRLRLRHVVRRVVQSDAGVIATVEDASGVVSEIAADAVVMALPATLLRRVEFERPLADAQHHAIASLQYGCATKAIVQRATAGEWRRARAFATDADIGAFWDSTEGQMPASRPMLTYLAGGRASSGLRERARQGSAALLSPLCWLGGGMSRASGEDRVAWVSWEQEPFSGGGYAYLDPAFDPAWRALLSRRAGRIVFAGEHTSADWQGYMEGAVQSGFDAARKLLERAA